MASIRKKPTDSGFEINVPEKCIVGNESQITIQTFKKKLKGGGEARDVLNWVNARISQVRHGQKDISSWNRQEKIEWLRSGNDPVRLEDKELTFFTCYDQYIEECKENNAYSTVVGYEKTPEAGKGIFRRRCVVLYQKNSRTRIYYVDGQESYRRRKKSWQKVKPRI